MSQEKEAQKKFHKTREDKELEKVIALENKIKVLDDIVYKTGQSVQTMNMLNRNCKTSFVKPEFLKKAQRANPHLYDIGCYNDNLALMLAPESDKTIRLAQESRSKLIVKYECLEKELSKSKTMSKSFQALQKHAINFELTLQQYKEQIKNDKAFKENQSNLFMKECEQYFKIQDLKTQLQDKGIAISELKKLIEKMKGKYVETKFEKPSVIRQPNAFKSQRQSVLGKPATFSDSLAKKDFSKSKSVTTNNVSNDFSKQVTAYIFPQNVKSILKNTNVIAPGIYKLVEIILFILNSGCSKHMNGNLKLLSNFVEKFLGTVKFGNDQIAPILGYGDLVQGTITIKRVYYVEGLNHNLFSIGQFCDADLEVAFRKSTCYIRDLKGYDLLTGSRGTDLYSITLQDTSTPNPMCLMAKATSSQAWLWHRRLSHLNFDSINLLSKNDIVIGLPKLKFIKDHLCSSCELRKAKRKSFHTKTTPSSKRRLQLLHMDLCGPMRVESINGKKYVLVIVDDYSRYTWTHFLRSKDETPEVLIDFLKLVQRGLHAQVRIVQTDRGTEFLNKTLHVYFAQEGIEDETSVARTLNKTALSKDGTVLLDGENLDKMKEKGDACIFVGYSTQSRAYRVYNKRTRVIIETIHVNFDELPQMAPDHSFAVTAADASDKRQQQPDATSSTSALATTVSADGNFDL
ncbi:retrovirus-related pol polyprotein from transposon TNT 1-94 [Tanacetum coccineum]